jgi:hypothetical protein
VGGLRWAVWRTRCPSLFGRYSNAQATGCLEQRRLCGRRDTKLTEGQRLARRSSRCDHSRASGFRMSGLPAARPRAWRVTGGTIWRAGRDHSAAAGAARASVRPAGFVVAQRQGNQDRDPRSRERAAAHVPPALPAMKCPLLPCARAQRAVERKTKMGPKAHGSNKAQFGHRLD